MEIPESEDNIKSMQSKLDAIVKNDTCTVVDEKGRKTNVADIKWVVKLKFGADDDVECFKERLVARVSSQKYGVDLTPRLLIQ